MGIADRVRDKKLLSRIVQANEAVSIIKGQMTIATTGNSFSGFPRTLLLGLAEHLSRTDEKVTLFCIGALGEDIEEAFEKGNTISKRLGSLGNKAARRAVNDGKVSFLDVKSGVFPEQVARGDFGKVDVALIEAAAITKEGNIIPSTALSDGPRWVECAERVLIEINPMVPPSIEGIHDIYLPGPYPDRRPIPLEKIDQRIGTSYIPVGNDQISGIVETVHSLRESERFSRESEANIQIAENVVSYLEKMANTGIIPLPFPPLEVGIGNLGAAIMKKFQESSFDKIHLYLPGITEPVLDLIDSGKVNFVSATNLRIGKEGLERLFSGLEHYRDHILLRSIDVINSGEVIRRLGVIAINTAIEIDILGQVNSSHMMGVNVIGGIGGSYDYSRNAMLSIFATPSVAQQGEISSIVPLVSHVDHTEHDVDVVITEQGIADLRGLEPMDRAHRIVESCAHPSYRSALTEYLEKAKKNGSGRQPLVLEEAFSFHQRFARSKSMKMAFSMG